VTRGCKFAKLLLAVLIRARGAAMIQLMKQRAMLFSL
jgi:hypothetical protein